MTSFNKFNNKFIVCSSKNIINLFNGNQIDEIKNNSIDAIEVDSNYKLTDGYPKKKKVKSLIK